MIKSEPSDPVHYADLSLAIIKLLGRGAIMLAVTAFDVAIWMLWAALMLFGFVCSLKAATERMTLRYLRWRKACRVRTELRALA